MIDRDSLALAQLINSGPDGRFRHVVGHQVSWAVSVKIKVASTTDGRLWLMLFPTIQHLSNSIALGYYLTILNGD